MTEWRRKKYYDKRVLIEVDDVLENEYPGSVVCLTGAEMSVLRNLLEYAHRHSTFVAEYYATYYLAPDNEQWDDISEIIAELEGKLVPCEDIENKLDDIIALLGTQCQGGLVFDQVYTGDLTKIPGWGSLDTYPYDIEKGVGDPPGGYESWEEWEDALCCWMQWMVDESKDFVETIATIIGSYGHLSESALAGIMLATGLPIPITLAVALLGAIGVEVSRLGLEYLVEFLENHKKNLVCAAYLENNGWAAAGAVHTYIDENAPFPFSAYLKLILNRSAITAWYDGHHLPIPPEYDPEYCMSCELPIDEEKVWDFPPCPNNWTGPGIACCENDRLIAAWVASNWYANVSPTWSQAAGDVAISYSAWIWFDFSKWDFPPDLEDDIACVGLKRTSDGTVVSSRWFQREDVDDGWNLLHIVDETTDIVAGDYRMTFGHLDTNARCTGVQTGRIGITVTYNE
jgi:hypothetical protein